MPDITMCDNTECPLAESCLRNERSGTVPDQYHQSWTHFAPDKDGKCYAQYWFVVDHGYKEGK